MHLLELREAIETGPRRRLVGDYKDKAFSAHRCGPGPGMQDATAHADGLATSMGSSSYCGLYVRLIDHGSDYWQKTG